MSVQDDSPVRGMVPKSEYLRLQRRYDELEERYRLLKDKPPLAAENHFVHRPKKNRSGGKKREPHPDTMNGRVLALVRASKDGILARAIADEVGVARTANISTVLILLKERGYVRSTPTAPGQASVWFPIQPKEN